MAIYSLQVKIISRGQGHSATAAAAYRARALILDERTGQTHDYSRMKNEAVFTGIYAPQDAPAWAIDRQLLWNAVEKAEKRKDAQVARDLTIALPHELTPEQNRWLVQDFVRENFTRKGYVADVAIHAPSEEGSVLNIHAHIMVTMRVLGAENFAATKDRTMNSKEYLQGLRQSWEYQVNRHLERHGHAARIDHRSFKDQGIEYREPTIKMGKAASAAERKGHTTERGERQKKIAIRNRRVEELLRELAELQQQNRIAARFKKSRNESKNPSFVDSPHLVRSSSSVRHYARLIEDTPRQDTGEAVDRQARAEVRRITSASHHDRQEQQREAWRQIADAVMRHSTRNVSHTEEIRKAQAGLRAERKAGNRSGVQAWLRHLWQLHGNQHG
jgi:ATP-dependent exoDNAse (exonuclease V) alpha subunit